MANGGSVIFKFEGDTTDLEKATQKSESALATLTKSFTIAEIASTALNKGIELITENIGSAISRFDTMNNFPKVMQSLGFNSEDASKAVETLSDGLMGLPTALDDSITYVQRFTAKNNDLDKSSKIFLAINDAILAGGGSAQTQATAIEQFAQSFSKGKPDLMEWRTLLTAMPGQLKQIAQSMGYASADDLYEAFKNNKISMDDFTNAIIRLDEEGTNSIASFKEQAKNATGGIATSWKNLKTRTVKAITDVISKIDDNLKSIGGISGAIEKLGKFITNVIKIIGNGINTLFKFKKEIIAIGTAFLAWKVGAILTGMIQAFQKAQLALMLYKLETNGASIAQGLLNAQLTLGQTIVALFTGKITLAQLATALWSKAQATLNAVMSANPVGIVLVAVVALTAGIIALTTAMDHSSEEAKANAEEIKKMSESAEEAKNSFTQLEETQNKQISTGMSELNHTQNLANELKSLADATGYVDEKDRARAEFILGELNNALGTEYSMIDGQIQKYDELSASIDQQIEKKRLQVLMEAREEEYKKSISEWEDLLKKKEEARLKLEEEMNKDHNMFTKQDNDNLIKLQETYKEYDDAVNQASINIRSYEDAMTENLKGNTEEAKTLLLTKENSFKSFNDTVQLGAEEQTRVLKEQQDKALENLKIYGENFKNGVEGYTSQGLGLAIEYARRTKEEYTKAGKNIGYGLTDGIYATEGQVNDALYNVAQSSKNTFQSETGIHSPSTIFYGYGQNINQGLINGLNSNSGKVGGTIGSIASNLLSRMKNVLGIHSPSTVFRDVIGKNMALGIGLGFEKEMANVEDNINQSVKNIAPSLDLGDVFDLSPTLHNTSSSNSIVNVTVYNNMETDMMGNLINNIKTLSNGSKNDYNYGMT